MRRYMVHISNYTPATLRFTAFIDGFHPQDQTWGWLPIETWDYPAGTDGLASTLTKQLSAAGWHTTDTLPDNCASLPVEVAVTPMSRLGLLSTVQQHREHLQSQAQTADATLANLLADIPPATDEGHIGVGVLASKLNMTRQWIRRLANNLANDLATNWTKLPPADRERAEHQLTDAEQAAINDPAGSDSSRS